MGKRMKTCFTVENDNEEKTRKRFGEFLFCSCSDLTSLQCNELLMHMTCSKRSHKPATLRQVDSSFLIKQATFKDSRLGPVGEQELGLHLSLFLKAFGVVIPLSFGN